MGIFVSFLLLDKKTIIDRISIDLKGVVSLIFYLFLDVRLSYRLSFNLICISIRSRNKQNYIRLNIYTRNDISSKQNLQLQQNFEYFCDESSARNVHLSQVPKYRRCFIRKWERSTRRARIKISTPCENSIRRILFLRSGLRYRIIRGFYRWLDISTTLRAS